ncbi:unnamed protein product [Durusdinium trenchii]|uniref:Protein-S-isoprenylcysteine O-methyltransferase n=1 Tax=Durusdinium trenchii TaxID=1381693 RepID=A0ABP0KVK3_9DINO
MDLSDLMLAHRFVLSAPAFVCSAAVFKSRGLALKGLSRGPAVGEKARVCKAGLGSGYEFNVFLFLSSKLKFCFSSAIGPRFASPDEPLATSHPIFVHAVRAFAAPIPTTRRPTGEEPWSGSLLQIRIGRIAWARPGAAFLLEDWSDEFVGLEIPDRRIVQAGPASVPGHGRDFRCQACGGVKHGKFQEPRIEVLRGVYRCERHPAYLGAMLWGLGIQIALCNPVMLVLVSFVLWASLLHISLEEERELYDEFKGGYANYAALTSCWIPLFNSFLEDSAFQREMQDNCEEENENLQEETEEEEMEDDLHSEDDLLPTWEGVPKGGSLWNRQFREPWMLG